MIKPHLVLTPVNELCVCDAILWHGAIKIIHEMRRGAHETYVRFTDDKYSWLPNGKKYYAQTAFQAYTSCPGRRGHAITRALNGWGVNNLSCTVGTPRLDEGAGGADAVPREGDGGTADHVQSPAQPRASVRMTQGRNIKNGEQVAFDVNHSAFDGSRHININNAMIKIDPNRYYYVVNQLTK